MTTHLVCPVEDGPEEAPVDGRLVHHQTVFLIVARVARNGHNGIDACRQQQGHDHVTVMFKMVVGTRRGNKAQMLQQQGAGFVSQGTEGVQKGCVRL